MAAQCNAPLRFGKRIERRYVYKWYGVLGRYCIGTPLLVGLYILWAAYMARGFREPSRYNAFANGYNWRIYRRG